MNQLVRCINCDEIFLKTPFDLWPEYDSISNRSPEFFQCNEKDDFQEFSRNHHGHRLEDLQIIEDSFVSEKAYSEPIKISYFRATNGRKTFVIKRFREKINEPLRYQLISGNYTLKCIGIEIQSKEIRKQLNVEFKTNPFQQNQIDAFLKLFQHIAKNIDIEKLERIPEESSNSLNIYYKMDDTSLIYLLRNCRNIFKGQEYLNFEEFIHRHNDNGVLLLKAIYKIQITEMAKSKKKVIAQQIRSEKRKVAAKGQP
jgi:hypothetical protein